MPTKKAKRPPADKPCPEEKRLLLREPRDFSVFNPGDTGKHYEPGQGWRACKVVTINSGGVVVAAAGRQFTVKDSRNVLLTDEHKAFELHRARFARLCAKRKAEHEAQIALALAATAEPIPAGEVEL